MQQNSSNFQHSGGRSADLVFDEIQAGIYLGGIERPISRRTMQRWRQEGTGPVWLRVGRLVRYRQSSLDRFLATGIRTSTVHSSKVA
jgi:Helix-turn-helix domain